MKCKYRCCNDEVPQGGRKKCFCSRKCKNCYFVHKRRIALKLKGIEYKGGKCEICGYNKCKRALEFHHKDKTKKSFSVSVLPHTRSWARIKEEIDKCALVCANCHREIEDGEIKFLYGENYGM